MDIVTVYNPFSSTFSQAFDGQLYTIESFGSLMVTRDIGNHLAMHIAQRVLNEKLVSDRTNFYTQEDVVAQAKQYLNSVNVNTSPQPKVVRKEPIVAPAAVEEFVPEKEEILPEPQVVDADPVFKKASK